MRRPHTLSSLVLGYVLAILVVTMVLGFALYTQVTRDQFDRTTEREALAVAQAVAADPAVRAEMATGDRNGEVQRVAERMRLATGTAYVVVIDRAGVRHSHPNPAAGRPPHRRTGVRARREDPRRHRSGQPDRFGQRQGAADGARRHGDRRGFGRDPGTERLPAASGPRSRACWLYTGAALLAGVLASLVLARRLKRMTFGLELDELASLLQEREATLHGIREGVVAFDERGRLSMVNDEARRLLGWRHAAIGEPLEEVLPEGRLRDVLGGAAIRDRPGRADRRAPPGGEPDAGAGAGPATSVRW